MKPTTNIGASVHQRLKDAAESSGRTFNDLAQYYALERWLYRLSRSPYAQDFILKGALMLVAWRAPVLRATRDIDLPARMSNDLDKIKEAVAVVCRTEVPEDGLFFDAQTVTTVRIAEDADYEGVRFCCTFSYRIAVFQFARPDEILSTASEPGHQELCDLERDFFRRAIAGEENLDGHLESAVESLRVVLAAEQSMKEARAVDLRP